MTMYAIQKALVTALEIVGEEVGLDVDKIQKAIR
jgi:hypothetical protein